MRDFLRYLWSLVEYQFGLKLLSILIGITLWVVVFGSRTIEITKEVPFEVVMSDDQILVDPVPDKVSFRLTGPKAFLRSITNRIEDPIRANIRELKTGIFTHRVYSDSIKLPLGVKVQSISPNVIQLRVEELKRKMVGVRLVTTGEIPNGYKVVRTEVLPPQVRIKGPKNRMSSLTSLPSLPIDLGSLRETTIIPLAFDFKALGIEPDSAVPELNVEIQGKGQAFRVRHVPIKIKTTGKAKSDDEEVMVIVRTDPADSIKIDGDQVQAEIDVRDLPDGEALKWIRITLPEKVHLVRVIPPLTRVVVKGQ
jgi:YbbR domain-containing protein